MGKCREWDPSSMMVAIDCCSLNGHESWWPSEERDRENWQALDMRRHHKTARRLTFKSLELASDGASILTTNNGAEFGSGSGSRNEQSDESECESGSYSDGEWATMKELDVEEEIGGDGRCCDCWRHDSHLSAAHDEDHLRAWSLAAADASATSKQNHSLHSGSWIAKHHDGLDKSSDNNPVGHFIIASDINNNNNNTNDNDGEMNRCAGVTISRNGKHQISSLPRVGKKLEPDNRPNGVSSEQIIGSLNELRSMRMRMGIRMRIRMGMGINLTGGHSESDFTFPANRRAHRRRRSASWSSRSSWSWASASASSSSSLELDLDLAPMERIESLGGAQSVNRSMQVATRSEPHQQTKSMSQNESSKGISCCKSSRSNKSTHEQQATSKPLAPIASQTKPQQQAKRKPRAPPRRPSRQRAALEAGEPEAGGSCSGVMIYHTFESAIEAPERNDKTDGSKVYAEQSGQCKPTPAAKLSPPSPSHSSLPNNTLLVDLNESHPKLTSVWPTWRPFAFRWPSFLQPGRRLQLELGQPRASRLRLSFHMPEPLMRTSSSLKPSDYNKALSVLNADVRFKLHLLFYRQVQCLWLIFSTIICALLPIVLANLEVLMLASVFALWLGLQLTGVLATRQIRTKLDLMLERSVAQVNSYFLDHDLMLGVINSGGLWAKRKLKVPMIYFDTSQCREQVESIVGIYAPGNNDMNGKIKGNDDDDDDNKKTNTSNQILDYTTTTTTTTAIDMPLKKSNVMALAQSQLAKKIVLRYSQRWISQFDKRKLMFYDDRIKSRHLSTGKCMCQFIEEQFIYNNNEESHHHHLHDLHHHHHHPYYNHEQFDYEPKQQQQQQQQLRSQYPARTLKELITQRQEACILNGFSQSFTDGNRLPANRLNGRESVEIQEIPRGIHNSNQTLVPISTVSQSVSLRDRSSYFDFRTTRSESGDSDAQRAQKASSGPNATSNGNNLHLDLGDMQLTNGSRPPKSPLGSLETPLSSPDLSLEMGGEHVSRSDDLVRKLRLLLELRKNELQGIDGSLFSSVLYRAPHNFGFPLTDYSQQEIDDSQQYEMPISSHKQEACQASAYELHSATNQAQNQKEARFFTQREGLFFMGPANKKSQQDPDRRRHLVGIC